MFLNHYGKILIGQGQRRLQKRPVETSTRVVFASWRDMFMAGEMLDGIGLKERCAQSRQRLVLSKFKAIAFQPFQLDADGVVVTVVAAAIGRGACVPGAVLAGDKLPKRARACDKKMS